MNKQPSSLRPLAIVVDAEDLKLWQSIKEQFKAKKDSTAFTRLLADYKKLKGE